MARHRVAGLCLAADISLPELPTTRAAAADISVRLLPPRRARAAPRAWLHQWRATSGPIRVSLGRTRGGYLLRVAALADFLVSRDGRFIRCRPVPGAEPVSIRHALIDQILPMVLGHRGHLVLHASAARTARGAVVFAGQTGWGKSTLCAALTGAGLPALADDCVTLEERRGRLVAVPSYPGLRLWPDAARALRHDIACAALVADGSAKRRIEPARQSGSAPLLAIYVLTPPGRAKRVRIAGLKPREAVGRLLAHVHRLDITDRGRLARELHALARLADRVPVFEIDYPRDLRRLKRLRTAVLRHAEAQP